MPIRIVTATLAGPWGPVHVAAGERGVVAVEWLEGAAGFDERWRRRFGSDAFDGSAEPDDERIGHLQAATRALEAILAGEPPDTLPAFDLRDRPAWDRAVLGAVARIGWGDTASYGDMARRIGSPRAARAVGGAVGRNPIGLLIPCHRVISGDGSIGGYGGDAWGSRDDRLAIKRALLAREGVRLRDEDPATMGAGELESMRTTPAGWASSGRRR
jgi:methylated-DNA-[protein]-cysteine S-methyltransferase